MALYFKRKGPKTPSRMAGMELPMDWQPVPLEPSDRFKREMKEKRYCDFTNKKPKITKLLDQAVQTEDKAGE